MPRPFKSKNQALAPEELEVLLIWHTLGYTPTEIAAGMCITKASVLHQIYKGKKAWAIVGKLQVWKDYDHDAERAKFYAAANCPNEGFSVAGQEGQELHPQGCTQPCCTGTRLRDLGRLDASLQLPECGLFREPRSKRKVRELEQCETEALLLWQGVGHSTQAIAQGMRLPETGT